MSYQEIGGSCGEETIPNNQSIKRQSKPLEGLGFCDPDKSPKFVPFNRPLLDEIILYNSNPIVECAALELRRGRQVNISSKKRPV